MATGGKENRRTVQLAIGLGGKKFPPYTIFKGAPVKRKSNGEFPKRTIMREIDEKLPDKDNNMYPDEKDAYITCSKTANSSGELMINILQKVIIPTIGGEDRQESALLCDSFTGHFDKKVKTFVQDLE